MRQEQERQAQREGVHLGCEQEARLHDQRGGDSVSFRLIRQERRRCSRPEGILQALR